MSNDDHKTNQEELLAFMCDHLVALCGTYACLDCGGLGKGEERFFALPGFILMARGIWRFVTAAHLIEEIEDERSTHDYRLINCCLATHFRNNSPTEELIPFDFESSPKLCISDQAAGLDFAVVTLTEEQMLALRNNGIRPISQENWSQQRVDACEMFFLLGLPHCPVRDHDKIIPYGNGVAGVVNPVLVSVKRIELPLDEMPESTYPWFVDVVGGAAGLADIQGMSGGPIFGFFKGPDERWQYWIVALQSRWNDERRIIFACPVPAVAQIVEQE